MYNPTHTKWHIQATSRFLEASLDDAGLFPCLFSSFVDALMWFDKFSSRHHFLSQINAKAEAQTR